MIESIFELLIAVSGALTAMFGLLEKVLGQWSKSPQILKNIRVSPSIWMFTISILIASIIGLGVTMSNSNPSGFMFVRFTDFGPETADFDDKHYSFTMIQSFKKDRTSLNEELLVRNYGSLEAPNSENPKSEVLYYSSADEHGTSLLVSPELKKTMRAGEQHHVVLEATDVLESSQQPALANGDNLEFWKCPDYTGLGFRHTGPTKLKELIFSLDFTALSENRSCQGLFPNRDSTPRYWMVTDSINQENISEPPDNSYCIKDFTEMYSLPRSNQCVWSSKIKNTNGIVAIEWRIEK